MPTSTRKQPQDRKPKQGKPLEDPGDFVYTSDAGHELTVTREELGELLTPGFIRRHRREDQGEISFLIVEGLERDDVLDLIDNSWSDYRRFAEEFGDYVGKVLELSMGESSAS